MNILAFDTSTETMSIAVQNAGQIFQYTGAGGAQASSRLIPEIQALLAQAGITLQKLDGIAFGAGPGAFTGLRASCAVAQGLGMGAHLPLFPINTLHAVALQRHKITGDLTIKAALDARMGEIYWQDFDFSAGPLGTPQGEPHLAKAVSEDFTLGILPAAHALLDLAADMLHKGQLTRPADARPLYVRNKVAQTIAERAPAQAAL
jgi:tRNA threonylcarbamoyladenosine biosynthesis protein TsaB